MYRRIVGRWSCTYDRVGAVSAVVNQKSGVTTPLSRYDYVRDAGNNPTSIKRTRGTTVYNEGFEYDAASRITKNCLTVAACASATQYVGYSYDNSGNRLTEQRVGTTTPGTIKYAYDAANQMISRTDQAGVVTPQVYNADGQLEGNRKWDVLGRITEETTGTATTKFTYDAMNLRRTVQNTAGTKKLSWDINNPLPMLGVETRTDNSVFRHRYAPDGSAVYVEHPGKSYPRSLLFPDAIGSITDIVDQAAGARWRYGYEPFGTKRTSEKLNTVAEDPQLGFSGAYLESTTGNYHLRARDLSPWGMFLSPDPLAPVIDDPYITAYAYANQQPTLLTDPSGLTPDLPGWAKEFLVGAYGSAFDIAESTPTGQISAITWRLATGKSQAEWYWHIANSYYGIDGNSIPSQAGAAVPFLIPIGGGAGAACRMIEAERFGFMLSKVGRPPAVGLSRKAVESAYVGMNKGGGHAIRHFIDDGLIPNSGSLESKLAKFEEITSPILKSPTKTFNWKLGGTMSRAFAGVVDGRTVVVFVAKEGPFKGKVLSAVVPGPARMAQWGLK